MDEHDQAIRDVLNGSKRDFNGSKKESAMMEKGKTLITVEIVETSKLGIYSIHAYDSDGLQISQTPCSARVGRVVSSVTDLIVNAGLTGSLPLVGIEDYLADDALMEKPIVPSGGRSKADDGPGFGDMVEGLANFLKKNGAK